MNGSTTGDVALPRSRASARAPAATSTPDQRPYAARADRAFGAPLALEDPVERLLIETAFDLACAAVTAEVELADLAREVTIALDDDLVGALRQAKAAARQANGVLPDGPSLDPATAPWDDVRGWRGFAPSASLASLPRLVRVGAVKEVLRLGGGGSLSMELPAFVPLFGRGPLVVQASGAALDRANEALAGLLVRLLATLPPGKLRLTLVDQAGMGRAFAELGDFAPAVRGDKVWDDPGQIAKELDTLAAHLSTVIQRHLGAEFDTIEVFNESAGPLAEAYRVLAVANFPAGFDGKTAERLLTLVKNGPKAGVYVLLSRDTSQPLPHGFSLPELLRPATVLEPAVEAELSREGAAQLFVTDSTGLAGRVVTLDAAPPRTLVERFAAALNAPAAAAERAALDFSATLAPSDPWTETTREGIEVPIGQRGAREPQVLVLGATGGTVHHGLIAGQTGSGKSVLLHTLILSAALRYDPEELAVYLVDFKEGVEFAVYRDLPHARVVTIESERELGRDVLARLQAELQVRGERFKQAGADVQTLSEYRRRRPDDVMPRILLIVDEYQLFFQRGDRLGMEARALIDDLVRRGRNFGLHVLLCSQTVGGGGAGGDLESSSLTQMALRIGLMLDEQNSLRLFGHDNPAAKYLDRPGRAVFNDKSGQVGANREFQVAWLSGEERGAIVARLAARSPRRPRVIECNRPAQVSTNEALAALAARPPAAPPRAIDLFFGEPMSLDEAHAAFRLRRQSRSQLLIVGQDEAVALAAFVAALVSVWLHWPRGRCRLLVLDLTNVDDPLHDQIERLRRLRPGVELGGRRDVARFVRTASEVLGERARLADAGEPAASDPVVLAIFGLQRARDCQRDGGAPETSRQLVRVTRDGPDLGVHTIVWADTWASLLRTFTTPEVAEFDGRLALGGGDALRTLGEAGQGVRLRPAQGVLRDQQQPPERMRKLRCYELDGLLAWLEASVHPAETQGQAIAGERS